MHEIPILSRDKNHPLADREHQAGANTLSETRLLDFLEVTTDWLWEVDSDLNFIYSKGRMREIIGFSHEEILNQVETNQEVRRFLSVWRDGFGDADRHRHTKVFNLDWIRADGVKRTVQVRGKPVHDANGAFEGYRGIARDVTETMNAALGTGRKGTFFRNLVEVTSDWVWEVDSDFVYTYSSPKVLDLLGYGPEEVIGKTIFDFMPRSEARSFAKVMNHTTRHRQSIIRFEKTGLRKNGGTVVLEVRGVPIIGDQGEILGYRGIDRDITRRRLEQENKIQIQKMETIGQLTGGIAHDFNNLLTIIIGNLRMIKNHAHALSQEDLRELLDDALSASEDGAELTHQLLAFSRKQPLNLIDFNLNHLITNFTRLLRRTFPQDIKLAVSTMPNLPEVHADPHQLQNALLNLALNARDALPRGGTIALTTDYTEVYDPIGKAALGLEPGRYAVTTVTDTGQGIPDDVLPHVFEPFFTTKESGKGSGLGLSMVYGFAKQSGGTVSIESGYDKGTRVSLYLPIATNISLDQHEGQIAETLAQSGNETILVVEDEPRLRRFAVRSLKTLGYHILEAEDGEQAQRILRETPRIDVLFSDIVMPGNLNGLELAQWAHNARPNLKILLTTGYSEVLQDGGSKQNDDFPIIQKPFSEHILTEKIRELLDQ